MDWLLANFPFMEEEWFKLIIIPILIFCSRILDVSIGTLRIIFVARGKKFIAPILGFVEVMLWLVVVSQVLKNLSHASYFIAYALGFSTGNFIGMILEEKLAIGHSIIRIITSNNSENLIKALSKENFGVTKIDAIGAKGEVDIIYTIVNRHCIDRVVEIIREFNPNAFYTIEDTRMATQGIFPKNDRFRMPKKIKKSK